MHTIDIRRARPDRHRPSARVLTFREARFFADLPVPDERVILFDGVNSAPGRVYAVHYGDETVTVAPDF